MPNNKSNPLDRLPSAANASAEPGCQAADLKGLLNAIVTQISDADRRHSDTLHQMQDRLSNLGRDARSLRARVPDQFQTAFDRIETGMAELAARIAEAGGRPQQPFAETHSSQDFAPAKPAAAQQPTHKNDNGYNQQQSPSNDAAEEPPVALRSAQQPGHAPLAGRTHKPQHPVDTFDVIESLPGDVSDPWDREAANALASVYDGEPRNYAQEPYAPQMADTPRVYASPAAPAPSAAAIDLGWFEKRFANVSERIEASLAEIRPDQCFFAMGQRLDQFERSFAQAFDNVATRHDVESVRLIEAHMVELVGHLEATQNYVSRIDVIEDQLGAIAQRLDEVHALAQTTGETPQAHAAPEIDVVAAVRAAAEDAAARVAAQMPKPMPPQAPPVIEGLDDMRHLIERSMSDARQSEENTSALLDTLQQAMIRLLDRMDAIEFNSARAAVAAAPAPAPQGPHHRTANMGVADYGRDELYAEPHLSYTQRDSRPDPLDEAVAAVAHKAPPAAATQRPAPSAPAPVSEAEASRRDMRAPPAAAAAPATVPAEPRTSEKLRQDFIADARRAKMRLEGDGDKESIVLPAPAAREIPAAAAKAAPGKAKAYMPQAEGKASAVSPRVVALSVALALAGAAYVMLPGKKTNMAGAPPSAMQAVAPAGSSAEGASQISKQAQGPGTAQEAGAASSASAAADAPPPEADFSKPATAPAGAPAQLNMHRTEGEIVPGDMTVGTAARPLHGIAVASNTASAEQVARARRDHAMANVSNRLGEAAAENPALVSPAAVEMNGTAGPAPGVMPGGARSSALDLPPASVGPLSLRLAAANGDASAEFEVGARLAEGKGTDQNFKDAAKWYQRAAAKGFAQAQYRLGTLYERGLGLKADEERAKEWYLRAGEQGNIKAMHNLAVLSANAKSGTPDYTTAAKWFTDAAERGLADSQFNLAVLFENGLGVDADMRQSFKWLSLAARGGDKEATRRRDIMKGKLSADDLAAAEGLVRAYRVRASDPLVNDARTAGEAWKKNPANGENG